MLALACSMNRAIRLGMGSKKTSTGDGTGVSYAGRQKLMRMSGRGGLFAAASKISPLFLGKMIGFRALGIS